MSLRGTLLRLAVVTLLCLPSYLSAQTDTNELKAAFARCKTISDEIAEIRDLAFTNIVSVEIQSKDDFIKYIEKEIDEQYGSKDDINNFVDALVLLGSLKEKIEFESTLKDMMTSQAAAHYDPRNNIYYLLMTDMDPFLVDVISSHELCHALQNQNFDLTKLIMDDPEAMRDNGDSALAKQCLAEGEATIVMMWWALTKQMQNAKPAQLSASVSLAIGVQASMDFDMIRDLMAQGVVDSSMLGSIADSVEALDKFPRFFMESMYMAYIQGSVAVDRVRTRGGWKAVDALYKNPPTSTEQILHPDKLIGERDNPTDVRIASLSKTPPEGWHIAEEDVLGELGTRILFSTWRDPTSTNSITPSVAAAGWDGDRYYYLKNKSGGELLVWKTVWDSEKDADEFESALHDNLIERYPNAEPSRGPSKLLTDTRSIYVSRNDTEICLINAPKGISPKPWIAACLKK